MISPRLALPITAAACTALLLAAAPAANAQVTVCGQAFGSTPFTLDTSCSPLPQLKFHINGQCFSACGEVVSEFNTSELTSTGTCFLFSCLPDFAYKDAFNATTRVYSSLGQSRESISCIVGSQQLASTTCPCIGCNGGVGSNTNNTPGEDPLLISVADLDYRLSSVGTGVKFDLNGDGELEKTAWTLAGGDEAFLALDRNFNGRIDNGLEIFGDETPQLPSPDPNGFRALAVFDDLLSGGNDDGKIDTQDSIYPHLLLWTDVNHDGQSQPEEMRALSDFVDAIHLGYQRNPRFDEFGNELRYWAPIQRSANSSGAVVAWNVFFSNKPTTRQ